MNREEFYKKVHGQALKDRKKKIKELLEKDNIDELEISIIQIWCKYYGRETY